MSTVRELRIAWEDLSLAGDLHVADGPGPHPAILMMQGSGPADRTSGGYFPPIADAFLTAGLAVFSFDKPGCGASTGDWRDHGLHGRAAQAEAVLDALADLDDIDPDRLGVFGHSQGGWLVQMLAGDRADLAFAISSSGPSIGMAEQHRYDCEHTMRADGRPEAEIAEVQEFVGRLHAAGVAGSSHHEVATELLAEVKTRPWYRRYATVDDDRDWHLFQTLLTEGHDPLASLGRVRCPYLAVFGEDDVLVPASRGATETKAALAEAPTDDATVVLYPDANHRLQEYADGPFVDGYPDLLTTWLAERVAR